MIIQVNDIQFYMLIMFKPLEPDIMPALKK